MLYLITFLFSLASFSMSEQMQKCMSGVFDRSGFTKLEQRQLVVGQGTGAYRQRIRTFLANAKPAVYTKHTKARNIVEAREFSKREAQYLPGLVREKIEARALRTDTPGVFREKRGTLYKYVKLERPVGYDSGELTHYMRVELSHSGEYHGHPMSLARIRTDCPECSL